MATLFTLRFSTYDDLEYYRRTMRLLTGNPSYTDGLVELYEGILSRYDKKNPPRGSLQDFYLLKIQELFSQGPAPELQEETRKRKTSQSQTTKKSPRRSPEKEPVVPEVEDWETLDSPSVERASTVEEAEELAREATTEYLGWIEEVFDHTRKLTYQDLLNETRKLMRAFGNALPVGKSFEDVEFIDYVLEILGEQGWDEDTLVFQNGESNFREIVTQIYDAIELD